LVAIQRIMHAATCTSSMLYLPGAGRAMLGCCAAVAGLAHRLCTPDQLHAVAYCAALRITTYALTHLCTACVLRAGYMLPSTPLLLRHPLCVTRRARSHRHPCWRQTSMRDATSPRHQVSTAACPQFSSLLCAWTTLHTSALRCSKCSHMCRHDGRGMQRCWC
jgi:hypothetical protein